MNCTQITTEAAPAAAPAARLCSSIPPWQEDGGRQNLQSAPLLPSGNGAEDLKQAFLAAPHFKGVPLEAFLADQAPLRVILLCENPYYALQAAVYISSLRRASGETEEDEAWDELYFEPSCRLPSTREALALVHPQLLDPDLQPQGTRGPKTVSMMTDSPGDDPALPENTPQLLLGAQQGPVLTDRVISALALPSRGDVFVALQPAQQTGPMIDRLRFEQGFTLATVQDPDEAYLRQVFYAAARVQHLPLAKGLSFQALLGDLRSMRGAYFSEYDFAALLAYAAKNHGRAAPLTTEDLLWRPFQSGRRSGAEQLARLVGLDTVKQTLRRVLALAQLEKRQALAGRRVLPTCRNLAFSGKPGTCKSVTARIVAEILRECGVGSGAFVEVGREDLIGEYLGQTSPKIAALFAKARGGVLFIDEAGALLNTHQDSYAEEAVNGLVRHMELCPETMVIFATYPEETQSLLRSNPGLASRIAQVIRFEPYSEPQLYEILLYLAEKNETRVEPAAQSVCTDFFAALKRRAGDSFGNGREARRLLTAAQEQLALRALEDTALPLDLLTRADFAAAAETLLAASVKEPRVLGF